MADVSSFFSDGSSEGLRIETTQPDKILRHNISDEELDMLCEGKRDTVLEFLWIAIGALIGSAPSAISSLIGYFDKDSTKVIELSDLIQIVLFFVGVSLIVVLGIVSTRRSKRAGNLQTQIRARTSSAKPT